MFNKDLDHADERKLILSSVKGVIRFDGDVTIDDDDENGYFTLTQEYYWNGETKTRTMLCQLTVKEVKTN